MKPLKFNDKLTLTFTAVFAFLLTIASVLFYYVLSHQIDVDLYNELRQRSAALRGYLRIEGDQVALDYDATDPDEAFFIENTTRYAQIYDIENGRLLFRSALLESLGFQYSPEEVKEFSRTAGFFNSLETDQVDLVLHNHIFRVPNGRHYLLLVGLPLTSRNSILRKTAQALFWLVPVGVGLSLLSGMWMMKRALKPMEILSDTAREMSISQLHRRLPLTGAGDELDRLATTFNDLFSRLQNSVRQLRDFTSNISHELRTPLTVLRGEAEIALAHAGTESEYRHVLESQLEEFNKLSIMVDRMLTLARAEAGQIKLAHERINLSAFSRSIVEQMEVVAASKSIDLAAMTDEEIYIAGDPGWMERVLLNLLDNAIKFTGEGGRVNVSVSRRGGEALLQVLDNGIGIPEEAIPHVMERFYRGDESRAKLYDGIGLGLSMVDWIVTQHHGRINISSRRGQGTAVSILLPLDTVEETLPPG